MVEIWHCDAEGAYSGYPKELSRDLWKTAMLMLRHGEEDVPTTNDQRFLRGAQVSDAAGMLEFTTIFPGWYEGRPPHIHFKISVDEKETFISQFYFDDDYCKRLYQSQLNLSYLNLFKTVSSLAMSSIALVGIVFASMAQGVIFTPVV